MTPAATHPGRTPDRRAVAILPARLASTRLPRKMLLDATGAPLIVHSARNVLAAGVFARVVVAADDPAIVAAVRGSGLEAALTRADHQSGTDRVHECFAALAAAGEKADVVVNVQGDEPELDRGDLARLVRAFDDDLVEVATLAVPLDDAALLEQRSVVKVVCNARGDALYFSRAPIPARGHESASSVPLARRHVGVYAFTPRALTQFCALPRGVLEREENLEQLRWLEQGRPVRVVAASQAPRGIDTLADYEAFVARVKSARSGSASRGDTSAQTRTRAGTG